MLSHEDCTTEEASIRSKKPRKSRKQNFLPYEMTWYLLERVFRHYWEFLSLYEQEGVEEITLDNGVTINVHDVLRGLDSLPEKQRLAIELTCLLNLKEEEASRKMFPQSRWTSQVGIYKRAGLSYLVENYWQRSNDA